MVYFLVLLVAYLLGAIPIGYLVGQARGVNIRQQGSGNIGTTNAIRVLGVVPGLLVLLGDAGKGLLAIVLARAVGGGAGLPLLAGILVMVGHSWSVFLGFKGGKGVATSAGVLLALAPGVLGAALTVWLVVLALSRYVSMASIMASVSVPILMLVFNQGLGYFLFGLVAAAVVIVRHRPNLERLRHGREPKLRFNKK